MPQASKTEHHPVPETNFKFQTYDSPASEDVMWQDGRNLWINPRGYTERRPGFSLALEPTPSDIEAPVSITTVAVNQVQVTIEMVPFGFNFLSGGGGGGTVQAAFATIVTAADHGYSLGQQVVFNLGTYTNLNGLPNLTISEVLSSTSFKVSLGWVLFGSWSVYGPAAETGTVTGLTSSAAPTATGEVQRLFSWRKWDEADSGLKRGKFFVMASVVSSSTSSVYKLEVGTDASFVLLHTSYADLPYDFVTSNNYVYFSNGTDAWKWDGSSLTRWGIAAPATPPVVGVVGSVSDAYTSRPSLYSNPGFFSTPEAVWDATTATGSVKQVANQQLAQFCTWQGFKAIPGTVSALTLYVSSYMQCATNSSPTAYIDISYSLDKGENYTSMIRLSGVGTRPTTLDSVTLDPATDLTKLIVKVEVFDQHDHAAYVNVLEIYVDGTAAASTSATNGLSYCYTYGRSDTGHESSPSRVSVNTGAVNAKYMTVDVVASDDSQVNQIRVYRTTNGGSTDPSQMQEIASSPFANTTATIADSTADIDLQSRVAPALYRNDPPKAMRGVIRSEISGRLCGFAGHNFYYSGAEEIGFGVREECWPGGADGNYRSMGQEIGGIGDLPTGPMILLPDKIIQLQGDTLDTFRWKKLADRRGSREPASVTSNEGLVIWRDTSGKCYGSDGSEFGYALRNLLKTIPVGSCQICVHTGGEFNWICVLDSSAGLLYVYDVDQDKWNVPWTVAATCIASVEIAAGEYALLASIGGTVYRLVEETWNDAGSPYAAWGIENLWPLAADGHPDYNGALDYVSLETGTVLPTSVKVLTDDATYTVDTPGVQHWTPITANASAAHRRHQGVNLLETWYSAQGVTEGCRRVSIRLDWATADQNFFLYSQDVAYHPAGG